MFTRSKRRKMMAAEEVRLDYLVVARCVAHMRQGFVDYIRQEKVSRQFATALKSVLSKRPASMTFLADNDFLYIEIECAASKSLMLHHEGALPSERIIEYHGQDCFNIRMGLGVLLRRLKNAWSKIFNLFKRIKSLIILDTSKLAHKILMRFAIIPEDVCVRRLEMETDFQDTSKLLLSVGSHVKELKLEDKFAIGPVASKQLWDTVAMFPQLRHLNITSTNYSDFEYDCCSRTDALSCLKVLRLKCFKVGGSGARQLFDSADTILSTFQDNSNLRRLDLEAEAQLLSSPLLLPILSNLHHLSINALFAKPLSNPVAEDDELMSGIRFILQSLPDNATLCVKLLLTESEDEVGEQMLDCVKTFLELSNTAKKPIRLHFVHRYCELSSPDVHGMADFIEQQEWFRREVEDRNLFKVERVGRTCVVSGSNAKVIISVLNE